MLIHVRRNPPVHVIYVYEKWSRRRSVWVQWNLWDRSHTCRAHGHSKTQGSLTPRMLCILHTGKYLVGQQSSGHSTKGGHIPFSLADFPLPKYILTLSDIIVFSIFDAISFWWISGGKNKQALAIINSCQSV